MQLLIRAASGHFWQIAQIQVSGNIFWLDLAKFQHRCSAHWLFTADRNETSLGLSASELYDTQ